MSKFLPSVVVADTLRELEVPTEAFRKDFRKVLQAGLKRLYGFQNSDGGWGWFSNDGSATFMTAYVVYGLARAGKAGIAVDASAVERGVAYLKKALPSEKDKNMVAYTLFALATAGEPQTERAKALAKECDGLSSYAKALLALALRAAGETERAAEVLAELEKDKLVDGERVHFETKDWYYKWENVSIETTAYVMKAFVEIKPNSGLLPAMAKWLLSKREGNKWHTTKDSAAAIYGLIAYAAGCGGSLSGVAKAVGSGKADDGKKRPEFRREITVRLNETHKRKIVLDLNNPTTSRFVCRFDAGLLRTGENTLRFYFDPAGMPADLHCFATLRYTVESDRLEPEENGLVVRTRYEKPPDELRRDDEVEVTVEVSAKEEYNYIIIESPIPAGASVVRGSGSGVLAAFESRFDRAILFVERLTPGAHTFKYRIRCNHPGDYSVLPTTATLMYNTLVNGRDRSRTAKIGE